jgi:hypothetical protein
MNLRELIAKKQMFTKNIQLQVFVIIIENSFLEDLYTLGKT